MKPLQYEEGYELYELILKDEEDEVFALSLVSEPAIQQDFIWFSEDGKMEVKFATADEDQRTIVGPILIPEIKILRMKEDGTPYYVTFSKDTVRRIAQKYIKDNNANNITIEHKKPVDGVSLVESWIADSPIYDKSRQYGLAIRPGTWMGVFRVDSDLVWNDFVKTGKVRGISLEGLFTHSLMQASKVEIDWLEKNVEELNETEAETLLGYVKALIKKDKRYKKKERVEMESYSDYGSGIRGNAKRGIELNEKNGNKCATQTGKVRSQQLANGEPISIETIKRMYSYLSRAETYYDNADSTSDCGYISYLLWGGKAGLSWSRNKLRELGLLTETEAQPTVDSSYTGQGPKKKKKDFTSPALLQEECPESTQNIKVNLENRQKAIDEANYGPLNPNEPNEEYWKRKAEQFEGNIESAKKALCGNCAFFYRTEKILNCIKEGLGDNVDPEMSIEAGEIGYCEAYDFKCAAKRTCDAWVVGGPVVD